MTNGAFMLPFLLSVVVISLSGVMMPGPLFAVTVAKSYKSQLAGMQIALGHALVEIPLILFIYFPCTSPDTPAYAFRRVSQISCATTSYPK